MLFYSSVKGGSSPFARVLSFEMNPDVYYKCGKCSFSTQNPTSFKCHDHVSKCGSCSFFTSNDATFLEHFRRDHANDSAAAAKRRFPQAAKNVTLTLPDVKVTNVNNSAAKRIDLDTARKLATNVRRANAIRNNNGMKNKLPVINTTTAKAGNGKPASQKGANNGLIIRKENATTTSSSSDSAVQQIKRRQQQQQQQQQQNDDGGDFRLLNYMIDDQRYHLIHASF